MSVRLGIALLVLCFSCKKGPVKSALVDKCKPNVSSTYFLCLDTLSNAKTADGSIRFRLLSMEGEQIVDGEIRSGRVSWLDEFAFEIYETPGMVPTQLSKEDLITVYSIKTKSFLTKKQYIENK